MKNNNFILTIIINIFVFAAVVLIGSYTGIGDRISSENFFNRASYAIESFTGGEY